MSDTAQTVVGLIDCNNFFVSCERLFQPGLKQQPVLVLSANDGCVVARSQEVKDIGIPMGVPYFKIKDIVREHDIQVFSGNITLYRDISRRVFEVVRRYRDTVEQYSIDESFFAVRADCGVPSLLQHLKDTVEREVGIPIAIAVAASKTQAKYATTVAKRVDRPVVLDPADWQQASAGLALGAVWGVGRRLAERYRSYSIHTAHDLMCADPARVRRLFGVVGARLQAELQGISTLPVTTVRPLQHSLMSSKSFKTNVTKQMVLADALAYHVRHVAAELRHMNATASCIRVSLRPGRHGSFALRGGSLEHRFIQGIQDDFTFLQAAQHMLSRLYESGVPYKKIGVTVSHISADSSTQSSLFGDAADTRHKQLFAAIDQLNTRADRELLTVGTRLQTAAWQPSAAHRSPAYTTRWSDIATVSAT